MGLDIFIFRIRKADKLENRVYNLQELEDMDLDYFRKEDMTDTLEAILPYCREIQAKAEWINVSKICREFQLSPAAFICKQTDQEIALFDPERDENGMVHISQQQIAEHYTRTREGAYYVFQAEQTAYWRKNYAVQNFFHAHIGQVKNIGFYPLEKKVLRAFNETFCNSQAPLPTDGPGEDSALFYHEWY